MPKHQISNAEVLTRGDANYSPYQDANGLESRRGLITPDLATYIFTPDADDANGVVESQNLTAAGVFSGAGIAGDLATDGVATFDVPRNAVAAWTGTAVLTVTGTDEYGEVMVESSGSGTSFTGKKAFKTVTGVSVSANVTALTVGTGDVFGLPFFLETKGHFLMLSADGLPEEPTVLAGVTTTPSATTGDVRGTIAPASAPDGTHQFGVLMLRKEGTGKVNFFGADQFGG